jgi:HEAT repeat protein
VSHPLVQALRDADPAVRRAACVSAPEDPAAVLLVDALIAALGDRERSVARAAGDALVAIGRRDRAVESALRKALRGDVPRLRIAAALALARLAPPGPALLPALVEALASPAGDVRWSAARLLVDTGRLHGEVLEVLLALGRGSASPLVRRMAAFCLRELAPDRPESARVLLAAARDDDLHVRRAALSALGALLDPAPEVTARLAEALGSDADPAARRIAATALGELGAALPAGLPRAAHDALEAARAGGRDPDLRRAAERALRRCAGAQQAGAPARDASGGEGEPCDTSS